MSRHSYSVLARTVLGLGLVVVFIVFSSAFAAAQTGSSTDATTGAATAVAPGATTILPGATLTPLPTLPPAVSETPAPTLPAYPFPVTTVPAPTPWPTATLPPPTPTTVVTLPPVVLPTGLPTIQPPAPASPTPYTPSTYPPGQLNRLTRLARVQGRHVAGVGGQVVSGPVEVTLPGNAFGRSLRLDLYTDTTYRVLPSGLLPQAFFTLDLTDETDGRPTHHLDQPAEMRVHLGGLGRAQTQLDALALVHYDAATDHWQTIPTRRQGAFIIADVSDFSAFSLVEDVGPDWQPSPLMDVADTDLFSGAASFTIPIEVPQGTHGVAPKLALTYSSTVPDGMDYAMWEGPGWAENETSGTQANWVGLGWNLGLGRITSEIDPADVYCDHDDQPDHQCPVPTYHLELNGVQETLECVGSGCSNERADWLTFETKRASYLKIVRRLDLRDANNMIPYNSHHLYFEVWDKSGTYYRFGWTSNSEHLRGAHQAPYDYRDEAWGLSLDLVQDPFGNRMEIDYFEDNSNSSRDAGGERPYTRAAYPARIRYTYNETAGGLGAGVYQREVRFNEALWSGCTTTPRYTCGWTNGVSTWTSQNRSDFTGDNTKYRYQQRYKLDDIISYVRVDGVNYPFRRYQLDYQTAQPIWDDEREESDGDIKLYERQGLNKIVLSQVTETGFANDLNGNTYPAVGRYGTTPSYQFAYWPTTGSGQPKRLQLQTATSALGGTVTWSYGEYLPCRLNDGGDCNQPKIKRWRVTERVADPHTFTMEVMRQRYVYGRPWAYDGAIGHEWVRALTDSTGNGNDWEWPSTYHLYMTPRKNWELLTRPDGFTYPSDWYKWLWGREMQTETRIGRTSSADAEDAGADVKGRVVQAYDLSGTGESREIRLWKTLTYRAPEQGGSAVDIVERQYAAYGNVQSEYECPDKASAIAPCAATGQFSRQTQRWYETLDVVNSTAWGQPGGRRYIVDRVIVAGVHGADTPGYWWPQVTYYSYDDRTAIPFANGSVVLGVAGPTDKGKLTMVRQVDCWRCSPETTADTRYDYDAVGNVTTTTTWDQFATNGTSQGTARAVTTEYDTTKTYVTAVKQPGNVFVESAYYGVAAYRAQQPGWVWDNNARVIPGAASPDATALLYDPFGRVTSITRPGDSQPTEERAYQFDATRGARLMVSQTQRLDGPQTMTTRTFYDGLGRAVLSKAPHPNGDGTAAIVATYYGPTGFGVDPRGVKTAETLPYGGALDGSYSRPTLTANFSTTPRLIYEYDGLGALTRTTRPDQGVSRVTPIREQRVTSAAERGAEFALPGSFNASFEDQGVATFCAAGWPCVAGVVERAPTGIDGRFALRVSGANPTASYGVGTIPAGATFSLSWLARRTAGSGALTARVTVNGAAVTPASAAISPTTLNEWTLYHWTFITPATSGSTLGIGFEVPAGVAYEVDDVHLSWGEVRERVETADGLGRAATMAERTNTTTWLKTRTTYDPLDRALQVTDPLTQTVTTTNYDGTRLSQHLVTDSDRGFIILRYDPQGNLVKQADGRGQWLTLCYDALDRVTAKHYTDVSNCASPGRTAEASYSYDDTTANLYRKGRRWQMTSRDGAGQETSQVTWSYDPRGRVTSEARRIDGVTYTTAYTYNSADLVKMMTYPDLEPVTTTYNEAGQVSGVSGWNTYLTSQSYDLAARPLITTLGSTGRTERTYDPLSQRLTQLRREVRAPVTYTAYDEARLSYSYDWFGNVTSLADGVTPTDNQTFSYDSLNRLVGVTGPYAQAFAYDERGNLTLRDSRQQYLYTAGKAHAVSHVGIDPSAPPRFRYDGAGNLTDRGCYAATGNCVESLTYDTEGRLTAVKEGGTARESYAYDGDGALVKRTTPASSAAIQVTEHFTTTSSAWTTTAASTWGVNTNDGHVTTLKTVGAGNWTTTAARTVTVSHGQTARVAFKVSQTSSQAVLALDTGSGNSYHRFGVYENGGKLYQATAASTSGGTSYINPSVLVDGFAAGVWYILELTVDDGAGDRVSVWRADTPSVRYEARWELPANRTWTFRHWAFAGTTWLDDYQEVRPAQAGSNARIVGKHYEYDSVSGSQTKRYYAGGQLLATRTGTTLRYIQPDHLGSTSTLTDGGGVVMAKERYAAFGERRRTSDTLTTDQLYTGQRLNILSNLYHYSDGSSAGRFYDPLLGRFVQADSVTPGTGHIALNRYAYANNSPVKYVDPNGNIAFVPLLIVGGAIALKVLDYGWTAYDVWQSTQVLNDPNASIADKQQAELNIVLAGTFEAAEPDDLLPVSLPLDDIGRKLAMGQMALPGLDDYVKKASNVAGEIHHFATNKHDTKWTAQFKAITDKYNLDLNGTWNKEILPGHGGGRTHPDEYHEWVFRQMQLVDQQAQGDPVRFKTLYDQLVKQPIRDNPDMIYREYWENLAP